MFWELAILISTAASFVLFSYMLLGFFFYIKSIVHFPLLYTAFSGNYESLSV